MQRFSEQQPGWISTSRCWQALLLATLLTSRPLLASEAAHAGGIPFVELLLKGVNLALLIGLILYFARAPLKKFFSDRRDSIDRKIHEASDALEKARARLAGLDESLAGLDAKIAQILAEAEKSGEQEKKDLIARAGELAELLRQSSLKAADTEEAVLRKQLILENLDQAIDKARQSMTKKIDSQAKRDYVDNFVEEVTRHG